MSYRNILCVRADNMGDVIMSTPAFNALKQTYNCHITLLTSVAGSLISNNIPFVDETIAADLPWVKVNQSLHQEYLQLLAQQLKEKQFDAAVIFTVYSQSALPAAMLVYMAGIPARIAYCRENPYDLLTTWLPDKEPYSFIQHQVERDIELVKAMGAYTCDKRLHVKVSTHAYPSLKNKLQLMAVNIDEPFIVCHPGVSEIKRQYPVALWKEFTSLLCEEMNMPVVFTGSAQDNEMINAITGNDNNNEIYNLSGRLSIEELIVLIQKAKLIVCVNTVTAHIAAATQTPVVVLYALTNPQHTPWMVSHKILYFPVHESVKSKNEIIGFVSNKWQHELSNYPLSAEIINAVEYCLTS